MWLLFLLLSTPHSHPQFVGSSGSLSCVEVEPVVLALVGAVM